MCRCKFHSCTVHDERLKSNLDPTEPTAVTTVESTAVDASSVEVAWVPAIKEECVDHYLVCMIDIKNLTQECHNKTDLQHTFTVSPYVSHLLRKHFM